MRWPWQREVLEHTPSPEEAERAVAIELGRFASSYSELADLARTVAGIAGSSLTTEELRRRTVAEALEEASRHSTAVEERMRSFGNRLVLDVEITALAVLTSQPRQGNLGFGWYYVGRLGRDDFMPYESYRLSEERLDYHFHARRILSRFTREISPAPQS